VTARPLILASTSRYRRTLLERFGVAFEVESPGVDESALAGETPRDRAIRLSLAKARAVAERHRDAVVIGSDQVAALGSRVLDKPGDEDSCRAQLAALSGNSAHFFTGCAVIGVDAHVRFEHVDVTTVYFRSLSAVEIERYVARERPLDCAGGFKVEALGIALFERIENVDPTALVGLPLVWLAGALRRAGYMLP
jgi:septum formation protein